MKAQDIEIVDLVGKKDVTFLVPAYQRNYKWTYKNEVETLLRDLDEFIESKNQDFFFGSIVIKSTNGIRQNYILVDGQQRITTFLLIVASLKERLSKEEINNLKVRIDIILETEIGKFKLNRIRDQEVVQKIIQGQHYLLNEDEKNSSYFKVFNSLLTFFKEKSLTWIETFFTKGLTKIKLAVVDLTENEDEFLVFESINSKGKSLSNADLIKNYIMMNCNDEQESIFENDVIGRINDDSLLDLYRQLFAIKIGELLSKNGKQLYYHFKKTFPKEMVNDELIQYLRKSVKIWIMINNNDFNNNFRIIPFTKGALLNFYSIAHVVIDKNSELVDGDLKILNPKLIENCFEKIAGIVVRRALQGSGRVESNRTFAKMSFHLNKTNCEFENFYEIIVRKLQELETNAGVLSDEKIRSRINNIDLYNTNKNILHWTLIAIETSLSQKPLNFKKISIEHIYPQTPNDKWDDNEEMKSLVNTLGNLSITNDNSALGNNNIDEKKKILEERSYLKINKFIYEQNTWTEQEIKNRANTILNLIFEIWKL